jgi:hypothetical protein
MWREKTPLTTITMLFLLMMTMTIWRSNKQLYIKGKEAEKIESIIFLISMKEDV